MTTPNQNSIPIALLGKDPATCDGVIKGMLPEYDIVHVCHDAPTAKTELRQLFEHKSSRPKSGKGSNVGRSEARIPQVIFVGGAFTEKEVDDMRKIEILQSVPWMYPPAAVRARGRGPPPADLVVAQARRSLTDHGLVPGHARRTQLGVWEYGNEDTVPWRPSSRL